jgi:hypothetical protein
MADERERVTRLPTRTLVRELQERIRLIAKVTVQVAFSDHALDRMDERDISDREVFDVLRSGLIEGAPWIEPKSGDDACKVVLRLKRSRAIGVVTIVLKVDKLVVKTVEWEDVR